MFPVRLLAAAVFLASTAPAFAYIDPGTGSMILQAVIGGVAGGLFVLRGWWRRLIAFLPGARKNPEERADNPTP
jgi:hypothetical protein